MICSRRARWCAVALLLAAGLCGCLPGGDSQADEEREPHFLMGRKLTQQDWQGERRVLGVFLNGAEIGERTADGRPVSGSSFVVLVNAGLEPVLFTLPPVRFGRGWLLELTTTDPAAQAQRFAAGGKLELESLSLCVLRRES